MGLVYGVCLKYFKNPDDAQDAVMQIYEELVVKLRKHDVEKFRPWLHTVARNHCLMALRSRKLPVEDLTDAVMYSDSFLHPDNAGDKEQQLVRMEDCIETLPEAQKEAIRQFYMQEKSYKEIAEQSGEDLGRVRSNIQNGRRNLKNCMDKKN